MRAQAAAQQPLSDEAVTAHANPPVDGEAAAPTNSTSQQPKQSLLAAAAKTRKTQPVETEQEKQLREEQQIMADLQRKQALRSAMENAQVDWLPYSVLSHHLLLFQNSQEEPWGSCL